MEELLKRIDEIILLINNEEKVLIRAGLYDSSLYSKIVFEIDEIIISSVGKVNDIYSNFTMAVTSKRTEIEKCRFFVGVLEGLKSWIRIKRDKNKRYQIFISSTFMDLESYRKSLADEISFRGHIPVGMEDFTACGENLETYIKRVIDNSDYYILILGQRWGTSLPNDESTSYTMMEFNYAESKNMRIIPLIYKGELKLNGNDLDVNGSKFNNFVKRISGLTPQYFKNCNELIKNAMKSLDNEIKSYPQKGWTRI